jgi:uncharacterized protein (DUF58 family)
MIGYLIFIFVVVVLVITAELTRRKGFNDLTITRKVEKPAISPGENFYMTMVIENNKRLPISFLLVSEKIAGEIQCIEDDDGLSSVEFSYHTTRYSVGGFERIKRKYTLKPKKRGTYLLKDLNISIGDALGFYTSDAETKDYIELLVYPKPADLSKLGINTTSLYGERVIRRWIYNDPLYVRGIREYNIEDRMKDIHWKSSLKMNKLMVKDYDYTSDLEVVLILDVQCGEPFYGSINSSVIEIGASLCAALAQHCIREGTPVGMWTNSQVIYYSDDYKGEIQPSLNSLKVIMELCARIDYTPSKSFDEYILEKSKHFNKNTTYIILSSFLNENSVQMLSRLRRSGFLVKLIDISEKSTLPSISGIEKAVFKAGDLK